MKKILFPILLSLSAQLFAQEVTSPSFPMPSVSSGFGLEIIAILIGVFFYVALPILLYCIGSYSLSLLNKHYNKKTSSKISWIPFVRYYDFIKQATKSGKKAFTITILPWLITVGSIAIFIVLGITIQSSIDSGVPIAMNIMAIMTLFGVITIISMSIWRAFIIAKYVKGDVTTALGLSTYTALVLWYIALDRVRKNTNIIGTLGFAAIGVMVCFYVGVLFVLGFSGVATFLGL